MTKNRMNPKVDVYVREAQKWREEIEKLRAILLGCGLTEELKWGKPCYTLQEGNVVVILPLKNYCALLFCKGALLNDTHGILVKAGESTQSARQLRITHAREIVKMGATLKAYIHQAIEVEKAGLKVTFKKNPEPVPVELQNKLDAAPALKTAFGALTPGRQRAYILYFSAPKQSNTRESRIEKCRQQILDGKELNDQYLSTRK